jgi:LPXTG-site transpeptidase (sortase) family protein
MATASKKHKAENKSRHKNQDRKHLASRLYILIASVGILLIIAGISYIFYSRYVLSFSADPYPSENIFRKTGLPVKLEIPAIGITLPVFEAQIKNGIWQTSDTGATHLLVSAVPGQKGNIIIYGHNKQSIFGHLADIPAGSLIMVTSDSGQKYYYKIKEVITVSPNNLDPVKPTLYEVLTVYTCTGFLDSKRLVIRAYPLLIPQVNPMP